MLSWAQRPIFTPSVQCKAPTYRHWSALLNIHHMYVLAVCFVAFATSKVNTHRCVLREQFVEQIAPSSALFHALACLQKGLTQSTMFRGVFISAFAEVIATTGPSMYSTVNVYFRSSRKGFALVVIHCHKYTNPPNSTLLIIDGNIGQIFSLYYVTQYQDFKFFIQI